MKRPEKKPFVPSLGMTGISFAALDTPRGRPILEPSMRPGAPKPRWLSGDWVAGDRHLPLDEAMGKGSK